MRYRPPDNRDLPKETFERKVRNNDYIRRIYDFPDIILSHPTPEQFQEIRMRQCASTAVVQVEIGCGSGSYLLELSRCFPEHRFVGFELRYKRLVLAAKKIKKARCANILLLKDQGEYLVDYFGIDSIEKIHVNFPDPWSKRKQRKHRLLNADFLEKMTRLLRPGGEFLFKTDHQEYFQSVRTMLSDLAQYQLLEQTTDLQRSAYQTANIETEFEKLLKYKSNPKIAYLKAQIRWEPLP